MIFAIIYNATSGKGLANALYLKSNLRHKKASQLGYKKPKLRGNLVGKAIGLFYHIFSYPNVFILLITTYKCDRFSVI